MKERIIAVIIESLKEVNATLKDPELEDPTPDTHLFGLQGHLDSLGLVTLVSVIESRISDEFDREIVIASEKAVSQKSSPFKSVRSLADYVEYLLKGEK